MYTRFICYLPCLQVAWLSSLRTRHRGHVAWKEIRFDGPYEDRGTRRSRNNTSNSSSNNSGSAIVSDVFAVKHYAGLVQYSLRPLEPHSSQGNDSNNDQNSKGKSSKDGSSSEGQWIEVNHFSSWPLELPSLLASSTHPAVRALVDFLPGYKKVVPHGTAATAGVATTTGSSNESTSSLSIIGDNNHNSATAGSELRNALKRVEATLTLCDIAYVRNLRPHSCPILSLPKANNTSSQQLFDRAYVAAQVRKRKYNY